MTMDEILEMYSQDAIDRSALGDEALKITKLFMKYLRIYVAENKELRRAENMYKRLYNLKSDWYFGTLNGTEELEKLGWGPNPKMTLKPDLPRVVEGDRDIIKQSEIVGEQRDKVNALKDICKEVRDRSFNIRAAMDWEKFMAGA